MHDNPITKKNYREKSKEWLKNYKYSHCCELCGYNEHPEILQFHHKKLIRRKGIRRHQSQGFTAGRSSIKWMQEEVEKCLLLCPNCHAWIHHKDNGFDFRGNNKGRRMK